MLASWRSAQTTKRFRRAGVARNKSDVAPIRRLPLVIEGFSQLLQVFAITPKGGA